MISLNDFRMADTSALLGTFLRKPIKIVQCHRTCIFKTVKLFDFGERIVAFLSPGIDCVRIMIVTQIKVRVKESMSLSTETEICGNILKQEFSCITKHRYMSNVQHFLLKQ